MGPNRGSVATDSGEGLGGPEPHKPPPPILYCMYTLYCLCVYTTAGPHYCILIHTRLNQREGMRGNTSQSWVKNKKMTFCRGIITAPSHAKLKVRYPPPPPRHFCACVGGPICSHMYISLFSQRSTGHSS